MVEAFGARLAIRFCGCSQRRGLDTVGQGRRGRPAGRAAPINPATVVLTVAALLAKKALEATRQQGGDRLGSRPQMLVVGRTRRCRSPTHPSSHRRQPQGPPALAFGQVSGVQLDQCWTAPARQPHSRPHTTLNVRSRRLTPQSHTCRAKPHRSPPAVAGRLQQLHRLTFDHRRSRTRPLPCERSAAPTRPLI